MSTFIYNEITLPYANVHSFAQRSISDASGTDWMLLNLDISVTAVINTAYAATIGVAGNSPAEIMNNMRKQLMTRRAGLEYTFNGVSIIPPPPSNNAGTVDANNGPVPQYCNISLLTDTTFVVDYRVVANYWEDPDPPGAVLSNRWSESVVIDRHNYSTYTRNGTYIIRSDNPQGLSIEGVNGNTSSGANSLREQFATLGIRPGCVRQAASYTVSPDGLRMQYQISDKEVFQLPPEPAFEADGVYVETSPAKVNAVRQSMCTLKLIGSKTTDVGQLVRTAVLGCASKMRAGAAGRNANVVMNWGQVAMQMYRNEVTVTMRGTLYADNNNKVPKFGGMAGVNYDKLLDTISTVGTKPPPHSIRGTAGIVLQAAAYFDPSVNAILNPQSGQMDKGAVPGTEGKNG